MLSSKPSSVFPPFNNFANLTFQTLPVGDVMGKGCIHVFLGCKWVIPRQTKRTKFGKLSIVSKWCQRVGVIRAALWRKLGVHACVFALSGTYMCPV